MSVVIVLLILIISATDFPPSDPIILNLKLKTNKLD